MGRGDAMTTTGLVCAACDIELPPNSKFCNECGAAVSAASKPAEYKQVTVLFADVVHSMDIAAIVGAEPLREVMADHADHRAVAIECTLQQAGNCGHFPPPTDQIRLRPMAAELLPGHLRR